MSFLKKYIEEEPLGLYHILMQVKQRLQKNYSFLVAIQEAGAVKKK
jgi:hypothetical protein